MYKSLRPIKEIEQEIEICKTKLQTLQKDFKNNKIPKDVYIHSKEELSNEIAILEWVFGENNRFD